MNNSKEDNIRIIEALIFASEKSINTKDLKKKTSACHRFKKYFT